MPSAIRNEASADPLLKPSRFDHVASLLISMLILCGTSVAVLVVLWLGVTRDVPITARDIKPGDRVDTIGTSEWNDLDEPLQSELSLFAIAEPITELSTLLSREAIAAAITIDVVEPPGMAGPPGASRVAGPPLPPEEVPRWERWEIRYDASSLASYAKQLDFFQIELGAAGGKKHVDYASRLADASPNTRSARGDEETRLYFAWRGGTLQALDRRLLQQAGFDVQGRIVLQFYRQEVEDLLARLESEHTEDGRVDKLRKTIFGVRRTQDGYEFYIIEQR